MKCHVSILDLDEYNITFQTLIHFAEPDSRHYWSREREARPKLWVACISDVQCFGGVTPHHVFLLRGTEKQNGPPWWTSLSSPRCASITWTRIPALLLVVWQICIYTFEGKGQLVLKLGKHNVVSHEITLTHHMARQCLCFMHVGLVSS